MVFSSHVSDKNRGYIPLGGLAEIFEEYNITLVFV
jgi:hypothetical protein